ncbi:hypothetical protein IEO21_00062 [Rhodonia placenta]|uniref:Uncharacterized protein n=1 Tax=Rhodonia placenta TaxID=104341 RepID=A0A8H7PC17_9APHY|nr:hypothetical protein IEO21_00062 [Postia placenta]
MAYPIQWLDATFNTRARTEELLRPDVESELITPHDFQLAAAFLPGLHRYWPYGYAMLGSGAAAGYARFYRRPPASLNRTSLLATVAGFLGATYGQFRRAKAHWTFTQLLDDPLAFSQALENVNQRTGGVRPLTWTLQRAKDAPGREDVHGDVPRPAEDVWASGTDSATQPEPAPKSAQVPATSVSETTLKNRWEEIRAANARKAGQSSSWDALRQNHERSRMQGQNGAAGADRLSGETDRAQEQAQFDALLEAERRIASR